MGHGKSETDGDSRIHRVSTRLQDRDADVRRQGLLGDNQALAGKHRFVGVHRRCQQTHAQY
jgi:hypothetical protein